MMTPYERVIHTIQGEVSDRVPVFAILGAYGGKLTGVDLQTIYNDADAYVAGQTAVLEHFGLDLALVPVDYSCIAEAWGGETVYFNDQAPNMKRPAARSCADVLKLPLPDPFSTKRLPYVVKTARKLYEHYQGTVPVFAAVPGPCVLPSLITGMEVWIETLLFDESTAIEIMNYTAPFFTAWINALADTGVTAVFVTEAMASSEILPRTLFEKRCLPHFIKTVSGVSCPMAMHHSGSIGHVIDLVKDIPAMAGVALGPKDDLCDARQAAGPEKLLLGNINGLDFPAFTEEKIYEVSLQCLTQAAPAGRFILMNAGGDIPLNTPPENIRAMVRAAKDYAELKEVQ